MKPGWRSFLPAAIVPAAPTGEPLAWLCHGSSSPPEHRAGLVARLLRYIVPPARFHALEHAPALVPSSRGAYGDDVDVSPHCLPMQRRTPSVFSCVSTRTVSVKVACRSNARPPDPASRKQCRQQVCRSAPGPICRNVVWPLPRRESRAGCPCIVCFQSRARSPELGPFEGFLAGSPPRVIPLRERHRGRWGDGLVCHPAPDDTALHHRADPLQPQQQGSVHLARPTRTLRLCSSAQAGFGLDRFPWPRPLDSPPGVKSACRSPLPGPGGA